MKKEELENLSESDEKVRQMLASLNRVEAPKDFEFRLKARIARANPKTFQSTSYKRRFAYALPAFASIVVSTFVVLNMNFLGDANQQQQLSSLPETSAAQTTIVQPQNSPAEAAFSETALAAAGSGERKETTEKNPSTAAAAGSNNRAEKDKSEEPSVTVAAIDTPPEKPKGDLRGGGREASRENKGFTKVSAGTSPPVLRPRGFNQDAKVETPKDFNSEKSFSVQEILSPLGVEVVTTENGRWKVRNVSPNSAAERSGIKTDDVIETLDGKKLSGSAPLRGKKIEVKKLGVKRGDAQVEINLQINPK